MKKIEKNFLKEFEESLHTNHSFSVIQDEIKEKYPKRNRHISLRLKLSIAVSCMVILFILAFIPYFIYLNRIPQITEIQITNLSDLVVEYEKNSQFTSKGIQLEKHLSNGTILKVNENEIIIDDKEFKASKVGKYPIKVYLKAKPEIKTEYEVQVIDDEIIAISLVKSRTIYYEGEMVESQDLIIEKQRASGTKKQAKFYEYDVETPKLFQSNFLYEIKAFLNTNPSFYVNYEVNVKSLDELDISGKYGYLDDITGKHCRDIFALEIQNDYIESKYSEIVLEGELKKEIKENQIVISDLKHLQTMIYEPFYNYLIVKGIAGDSDMICYKMEEGDCLIYIDGPLVLESTIYIARNGFLSEQTLSYLKQAYGGVYVDASQKEEITVDTEFKNTIKIYASGKTIEDDPKYYRGIWYDQNGWVVFSIEDDGIRFKGGYTLQSYTVEEHGDSYWIRIYANQEYRYNVKEDVIQYYDEGNLLATYHRFNPMDQVLITLMTGGSQQQKVLKRGDQLQAIEILRNEVRFYEISNYHNEPILEDKTFYNVTVSYMDISSLDFQLYGTYDDYLIIRNAWTSGRPSIGQQYTNYCEIYKNYQLVEVGFVEITAYESDLLTLTLHLESQKEKLYYKFSEKTFYYKEKAFTENKTPYLGLDFVGNYVSKDENKIKIDTKGNLNYEVVSSNGYVVRGYEATFISSMTENQVVLYYIYQNSKDEREVRTIELKKKDGIWHFDYKGETYFKNE